MLAGPGPGLVGVAVPGATAGRTRRQSILRSRKLWLALAILAALAVLVVRSNTTVLVGTYPSLDSYRVAEPGQLVISVAVAPRSWTRITNVDETATDVRVTIESFDWPIPLPGTAELEIRELTVPLVTSLDGRTVRDAAGTAIPLRAP